MGPTWSRVGERGITPAVGTSPKLGLRPTTPHSPDGMRMEPAVSVPTAPRQNPAAKAAPLPPEDPPGMRPVSHGLRVGGVEEPKANSCVRDLPISTAPARRNLCQTGAFCAGMLPASTRLPALVGTPAVSTRSLTARGIPSSGRAPRGSSTRERSARFDWRIARSSVTVANALTAGSNDPIRSRRARVNSTDESRRRRKRAAASLMDSSCSSTVGSYRRAGGGPAESPGAVSSAS